jgi:hypothetical protein
VLREAELSDEEVLLPDEDAPDDTDAAVERQRIPTEARKRTDVNAHREAREVWIFCAQRPTPSSAGSSSSSRS